jgi:elongation factor G
MGVGTQSIRNIAVTGHGSTGKTSLVEQILATANVIPKPETVESGKTVCDFTDEEISRAISIYTALSNAKWKEKKINLLDTPGSADFIGEVVSALHASDAVLLLVGADTGVQIETIKIWQRLNKRNMPRIVFINKMEKEHADFDKTLEDLKEKFKGNFVPVSIPIGNAGAFRGIVNLLDQKAYIHQQGDKPKIEDVPADISDTVQEHRLALVEAAAEGNDTLMEKYLEKEDLSHEEILEGLREGLAANEFIPVLCGSALLNAGIQTLLDFVVEAAPSPEKSVKATNKDGEQIELAISAEGEPVCFVFKTSIDQFSGKISYLKVITGTLKPEADLFNVRTGQKERITKIFTCQGKNLEDVGEIEAGDLSCLTKLDSVETGDTLSTQDNQVQLKPLLFPQPVHAVAISAKSKKDEDKLNQLLQRQAMEDPTFKVKYDNETKETVISSMGELHLFIVMDKIKEKQKIDVETRVPKVAYRETLTKPSGAEYLHKKQTGGHGQYAKVVLEIAPIERGENFRFVNAIFGGAISKGYIPGVEKGILEGMESGILAGYPVVDLEAKVVDGKEHSVDSSEMAFKLASRGALKAALEKAKPVLLEPIMNLEVFVDDQYLGDVLSDLSSRRGKVQGQEPIGGGIQVIKAQVPQAELLRYSIDLKSITSGTASFEMEFSHYSPITGKIAEDVIKTAKASQKS